MLQKGLPRSAPNDIPVEDEIAAPEKAGLAMTDKVIEERYPSVSGVEIRAMIPKAFGTVIARKAVTKQSLREVTDSEFLLCYHIAII